MAKITELPVGTTITRDDLIIYEDAPTGAAATKAISIENVITSLPATSALSGYVELATDAETIAGSDTARAVTPASLAARFLTGLIRGVTLIAQSVGFTISGGTTSKTLTVNKSLTLDGTDSTTMTFPTTSATIARTDAAQTFTGVQTFAAPILGTPTSGTLTNCNGLPLSGLSSSPITAVLTGYTSAPGTVGATDTVLQAIQKLNGNFEAGNVAYGVKWDTSASSPTLTKGLVVNGVFIPNNYTSYPIQSQMKRCVKSAAGAKLYNLDAANSIYKENQTTPLRSGTATSTSAGKLVDTAANFTTAGVAVGHWVHNTTTGIATQVTAKDSDTQLAVAMDIFASGNAYSVGTANPQADGAMLVEVPACQYIMCADGVYKYFLIGEGAFNLKKSDNTIVTSDWHPWFLEGGVFRPYQYIGAVESVWWDATDSLYKGHDGSTVYDTGDKAVSMPGFKPMTYQGRQEFRILHSNFGASYKTESYYADEFISLLFITEYGTLNSQAALPGYTEAAWSYAATRRTGRTMLLGNVSGSIEPMIAAGQVDNDVATSYGIVAGGKVANSYRGVENIFGHIWKWIDGVNFSDRKIYICNNPASWAEDTATGYTDTGLSLPTGGYQTNFHPGLMLPSTASGGGSTTYVCDYLSSAAGWRALLAGGYLNDGAPAGVFYRDALNAGSSRYANVGSRAAAV